MTNPYCLSVVIAIVIFFAGFVSASPGEIKVISGPRGQRVLHGKTGLEHYLTLVGKNKENVKLADGLELEDIID